MKSIRAVSAVFVAAAAGIGGYFWHERAGRVDVLPNVSYTLLDGTRATTQQLRGKVVLINFWATTCVPCMHEMPAIVSTQKMFDGRGYETLAVAMSYDVPAHVMNYAASSQLPFGIAIDNTGALAESFGNVQFTPTSLLVNKRGEIVGRYVGEPDFVALRKLVDRLLAET